MEEKQESLFKTIIKIIFKRIKPTTLLFLVITLSANVFAWFIYSTKVDSSITAHVKAWNVDFVVGNTSLTQQVNFDVETVYPGMPTYQRTINVTNSGETAATLSYEILSASLLGTVYTVGPSLTSEQLLYNIENNYPIQISFSVTNQTVNANGGQSSFVLTVDWPYESGDDATDTYWGEQAYDYHLLHPDSPSCSLSMEITAIQN